MLKKAVVLAFALLLLSPALFAQRRPPLGGLVAAGALQYYFLPSEPLTAALPGLRLGAAWEFPMFYGAWAAGLEVGWTHMGLIGLRRPSDSLEFLPITFRGGYGLVLGKSEALEDWMVRLDLLGGVAFSLAGDAAISGLAGARADAEYRFSSADGPLVWSAFAGGGVDLVPERDRLIWLPVVEAGVKMRLSPGGKIRQDMLAAAGPEPRRIKLGKSEGLVLQTLSVYFQPGMDTLTESANPALIAAARLLSRYPKARIVVAGHTSPFETAADRYAQRGVAENTPTRDMLDQRITLSQARARRVAEALTKGGIAYSRMSLGAYGATIPAAPNNTPEGQAANRRVEIILASPAF